MMTSDDTDASDASTLMETLALAARDGFGEQLVVTEHGLRCTHCDTTTPFATVDVSGCRRLEGASDPADMLLVVWGTCAGCGRGGAATIGYGPNANEHDATALNALDLDH